MPVVSCRRRASTTCRRRASSTCRPPARCGHPTRGPCTQPSPYKNPRQRASVIPDSSNYPILRINRFIWKIGYCSLSGIAYDGRREERCKSGPPKTWGCHQASAHTARPTICLGNDARGHSSKISEIERGAPGVAVGTILRILAAIHSVIIIRHEGTASKARPPTSKKSREFVDLDAIANTGLVSSPKKR